MAVACAFDRWRKDAFFPAAEAVQESADKMQSTYRMWMREQAQVSDSETWEELHRELLTTLGTAKWQVLGNCSLTGCNARQTPFNVGHVLVQTCTGSVNFVYWHGACSYDHFANISKLEEFDRAIKVTHKNCSSEDDNVARHRQFVDAIADQISQVEKALKDSHLGGEKVLRWVQLDEEECNDLAAFLSTAPQATQRDPDGSGPIQEVGRSAIVNGFREPLTVSDDSQCIVELGKNEACDRWLAGEQRRTWSSPDVSDWKIVISDDSSKGKVLKSGFQPPFRFINLYGLVKNTRMAAKSKWSKRNVRGNKSGVLLSRRWGLPSYLDVRMISRFTQGGNFSSQTNNNASSSCEGLGESPAQKTSGTIVAFKRRLKGLQYFTQFRSLRMITILLILAVFLIVPFIFHAN